MDAPGPGDERAARVVLRQEMEDLRSAVEDAEARERRHWTIAVFGASPSVVVVALGLLASGSWEILVAFSVIVALVEGWRASRAGREARELGMRLEALEGEAEADRLTPPPTDDA